MADVVRRDRLEGVWTFEGKMCERLGVGLQKCGGNRGEVCGQEQEDLERVCKTQLLNF